MKVDGEKLKARQETRHRRRARWGAHQMLRRNLPWLGKRFQSDISRDLRTKASIAEPKRYHITVPRNPQRTAATIPRCSETNIIPKAGSEIGRSATKRIAKGYFDGPLRSGAPVIQYKIHIKR